MGLPDLQSAKQKKKNEPTRPRKNTFYLAHPASSSLGVGPNSSLTSIPILHRPGLRSRVFTRSLGPPLSLWAQRSPIALLLFFRSGSTGSDRGAHLVWVGRVMVGRRSNHSFPRLRPRSCIFGVQADPPLVLSPSWEGWSTGWAMGLPVSLLPWVVCPPAHRPRCCSLVCWHGPSL